MEMDELLIQRDTQPNDDSQENGLLLSGPEASSPPQNQQHSAPPAAQPGELFSKTRNSSKKSKFWQRQKPGLPVMGQGCNTVHFPQPQFPQLILIWSNDVQWEELYAHNIVSNLCCKGAITLKICLQKFNKVVTST